MFQWLIYFIISLVATSAGAMTGMGGGVVIKPVLDAMGNFDVETIGLLSSITVFSMAIVSVAKQVQQRVKVNFSIAILLAIGSVIGGSLGQYLLTAIVNLVQNNHLVIAVQNTSLAFLIIVVFLYMLNKSRLPSYHVKGALLSFLVGMLLGLFSSFLGIGGGPINVALLIFLFSFDTKTAMVNSIITILFAQISKLSSVAITTGFAVFNLSMAVPMVIGAIAGGLIGSSLNKKLPEHTVEICFNLMQLMVMAICIFNVIYNLISC